MMPLLQGVHLHLVDRPSIAIYLFALWLLTTSIPVFRPLQLMSLLQLHGLLGYGGYFLMGALLARWHLARVPSSLLVLLFVAGAGVSFLMTRGLSIQAGALVDKANNYFSPNVVLATLAAFMLIGRVRLSPRGARISRQVAVLSFLIYFVHPVFIDLFLKTGAMGFLHQLPYLPSAGIVLAVALGAFLLSLLVSVLLRKLPYCQALLG